MKEGQHLIDKLPGVRAILDKCQDDVQAMVGIPVKVYFNLKFKLLPTEELLRIVMEVCDVTHSKMVSPRRQFQYVLARQLFSYFARTVQGKTLESIGKVLQQDHSSVIKSISKVKDMIDTKNEMYVPAFNEISERIESYFKQQAQKA